MKIDHIEPMRAFNTPIFEVPLPEFEPYHDQVIQLFSDMIATGKIRAHAHGYGYQTPQTLFFRKEFPQPYFIDVLGKGFLNICERVLYQHAQVDSSRPGGYAWVNTLTMGWANIQTAETWDHEPPWHTHRPATLTGCYYVSVGTHKDEGLLEIMNPGADMIFQPQVIAIKPKPGHVIIFPSYLRHRPTACPSTNIPRISLCIDTHWTIQMPHQLPPGALPKTRR